MLYLFQRDETSNTSTPTKLLPIDQIISHIASANSERQQVAQTPDGQAGAESTSAEASRRSSTSTQNTDTLTPTNIPSDPTDTQETIISATSAETVVEAHHNIQDDSSNSPSQSYQGSATQTQIQDAMVSANNVSEASKESQEQQDIVDTKESGTAKETSAVSDVAAEVSALTVPQPVRKVSRFLVSPVVEQKNIAAEEESSANEAADRTNIAASQPTAQPAAPTAIVEPVLKNEEHVEVNVLDTQNVTLHEQVSNNDPVVQGVPYTVEQTDSTQLVLQQGQQSVGVQQNIIQVQTLQQVTGHVQQTTTIGQSKQHTIILQGAITSQQATQQIPPTGVQHFVPVNSQKEMQQIQPLPTNGIAQAQVQYPSQPIIQPGVVMQQQIPVQQSVIAQPHQNVQAELQQHQAQMQAQARPAVQQFVPQQVQPPTQQYVMLSGHLQPMQTNIDDRNRRMSSISTASTVSVDSQLSESSNIPEEKRQGVTVASVPVAHVQHVQVVAQDQPSAMPLAQSMETAQQFQTTTHQNVQHVSGNVPPSMPAPLPVHTAVATDVSLPKATIKTKEVSSTLPDLAQNLANILSNPKSKSATPHPLTSHEPAVVSNNSTSVDYKPVQSEQYFQPIQPEASQLPVQPPVQQNYQGPIIHQGYQSQPNFQQAFTNQQLVHQSQVQPILQSIPLTIPQQMDVQAQMMQSALQSVAGQSIAQGKWIVTANQIPLQQPMRLIQPNQLQPLQNQLHLQQIPMQSQMQQQTVQDQQHSESSVVIEQSNLHLKLPEQNPVKHLETESLDSANLNWYAYFTISIFM